MPITQFEGHALVFNNGVVDVQQDGVSVVDSEKIAHIIGGSSYTAGDGISISNDEIALDQQWLLENGDVAHAASATNAVNAMNARSAQEADQIDGHYYSDITDLIDAKQDILTAGTNITIDNNVISASGGSGGLDSEGVLKVIKDNFGMSPSKEITYGGNQPFTNIPWWDQSWSPRGWNDNLPYALFNDRYKRMPISYASTGEYSYRLAIESILFNTDHLTETGWVAEYTLTGSYYLDGETTQVSQPIWFRNDGGDTYMSFAQGQDSDNLSITVDLATELNSKNYKKVRVSTESNTAYGSPIEVTETIETYDGRQYSYSISTWNYFYVDFYNNRVEMSKELLSYLHHLYQIPESLRLSQVRFPLNAIYICNYQREWRHYALDEHGVPDPEGEWVTTNLGPAYNVVPAQIRIVPEGIPDYWRKSYYWDEEKQEGFDCWPYTTPANYFVFQLDPDNAAEGLNGGDLFTGHIVHNDETGEDAFVVDYMNVSSK